MSEGKVDQVKGHVKETVGDLTEDPELKEEGQQDQVKGDLKEKVDSAKDKANSVIDKALNQNK